MTTEQASQYVTIFTANEINEYHDYHANDLPEDSVGYAEISVPNEVDWDHGELKDEVNRQAKRKFGAPYGVEGVAEGDDFANNDGLVDDAQWALFAIKAL